MLLAFLLAVTVPLQTQNWEVDGIQRTAMVHPPSAQAYGQGSGQASGQAKTTASVPIPVPIVGSQPKSTLQDDEAASSAASAGAKPPLVFVFHGHGGSSRNMARQNFAEQWPEAYFVYPQGLLTKSYYDPEGKRTGWQNQISNNDDRDLKFFDAMLETMLAKGVDPNRVYVTGHSNGGFFTYLLWAERRDKLAAVAPSAAAGADSLKLQPLPALHLAGRQDSIVHFASQERSMAFARLSNRCEDKSTPLDSIGNEYASTLDTPFVEYIHNGSHEFLNEAPTKIVAFFKLHVRPEQGYPKVEPIQPNATSDRFSQFDMNGDGKIDTNELQRPFLFQVLDKNSDGVITRIEADAALGKL